MKLKLTILLISLTTINSFSQENRSIISGNIYCLEKPLSDIHIINLNNKFGTISNKNGEFRILASVNDTLLFSSLQYKKKKISLSDIQIKNKNIVVQLYPLVNQLNEVYIEGLTGVLESDMNKVPEDTIPKISMNFKISFNKSPLEKRKGNEKSTIHAPLIPFGVKMKIDISGYKRYIKEKALRYSIKRKKDFPEKLKKDFGIDYFTEVLKIPKDKINHFLSYCEYRNIIDKYHNNKQLEVIEILIEESENYNNIKE